MGLDLKKVWGGIKAGGSKVWDGVEWVDDKLAAAEGAQQRAGQRTSRAREIIDRGAAVEVDGKVYEVGGTKSTSEVRNAYIDQLVAQWAGATVAERARMMSGTINRMPAALRAQVIAAITKVAPLPGSSSTKVDDNKTYEDYLKEAEEASKKKDKGESSGSGLNIKIVLPILAAAYSFLRK